MSRLLEQLVGGRFALVVALPANDVEMARAAEEAGADAIKVHLNITHRATGRKFGSLEEEREVLEAILASVRIPVGIVPAAEGADPGEVARVASMPFDFVDMFAHFMPAWLLEMGRWGHMAAADSSWSLDLLGGLGSVARIDMVELALIPPEGYGHPLNVRDLALYSQAVRAVGKPAIIPSQRRIEPDDVAALRATGAAGVMIGVLSVGESSQEIHRMTRAFRQAIDQG